MAVFKRRGLAFLKWEQFPGWNRETGKVKALSDYQRGTVMGEATSGPDSGYLLPWDPAAADGTETIAGILYTDVDNPETDLEVAYVGRGDALVAAEELVWKGGLSAGDITTGETALQAMNIRFVPFARGGPNV